MAEEGLPFRSVELTLLVQGSTFGGLLAPWVPRLVVIVRGSTTRMDLAVPDERRVDCRFGAIGVQLGASPPEASAAGERSMTWRDLSLDEIEALLAVLDAFSEGDVEGVPDTGDYYQSVALSGLVDDAPFGLRVSQMQSGWRGANAAQLVDVLRCLFGLAAVSLDEPRWSGLGKVRSS